MTRRNVYCISLGVFLAALGMTIASIIIPEWITWDTQLSNSSKPIRYTYGLHSRCSSITQSCRSFPRYKDCQGEDRTFCSLWRTAGFLMSASVALQLTSLLAFAIPIFGGKQKRESGWWLVCVVLGITVLCQVVGTGIIAGLHDNDERFHTGWVLGRSFGLCVASWVCMLFIGGGLAASACLLEEEGGYELIPDRNH